MQLIDVIAKTIQITRERGWLSGAASADMDAYLSSVSWSVAYAFDPTPGAGWEVIRPDGNLGDDVEAAEGKGYFVYLTADGTLTP